MSTKEIMLKFLQKWYLTPVRLAQFNKSNSQYCWRGCGEVGSFQHMWWHCAKIAVFWDIIFKEIKNNGAKSH